MYAVPSANDLISAKQTTDDQFLILYGLLLLLFQVGLACNESSRVRDKYTSEVFFKFFLHIVASCSMYWLIGYCLSFSNGNFFIGYPASWNLTTTTTTTSTAAADGVSSVNHSSDVDATFTSASTLLTSPTQSRWLYDALVIATPVTILSAVILERCNAITFVIYSVIISGVVHPISIHWAWTWQGWLHRLGYADFSGAGVVFAFTGASCFIASLMMGPRKGRFNENSEISPIYSTSLFSAGAFLTVIGLIAFNLGAFYRTYDDGNKSGGGNRDEYDGDGDYDPDIMANSLNKIVQNTIIGGTGGCVVALIVGRMRVQQSLWLFSNTVNGCLAAMVAVSGAVLTYNAVEAFIVGAIGALIFTALRYFALLLKIDDPIDACPIYFGGGVWGIVAMKIFSSNGMFNSKNLRNDAWYLLINFAGVMAICSWSILWTAVTTVLVKAIGKFTQKEEAEAQDTSDLYEEESCYIEALPYPCDISNDKMKTDRDEYISHLKNSTWEILKRDSCLYENMGLDMELQIRR